MRPPSNCLHPGCPTLCRGGYCEAHQKQRTQQMDQRRGSAASRGYGRRWQRASQAFLNEHPLCECEDCREQKRVLPATEVDHIKPHKGDSVLFWDSSNWQAMSKECHSRKTAKEDGRYGKAPAIATV